MTHALDATRWLLFKGQELLVNSVDLDFPLAAHLQQFGITVEQQYHIGFFNDHAVYAVELAQEVSPPEGYHFQHLRSLLVAVNSDKFSLAGTASQVLEWAKSHRFCSRCGTATVPHPQGERALVCPSCQYSQYPRINPCVIVAITKGDCILLARAQRFNRPMYSLLAGFVEAGETLEQAVEREVLEEVGIKVKNIRYFGSQAWPFPSNLMLGFTAEWASGELVLQEEEIMDAQFFKHDELPEIPPKGSIAAQIIHATVTELAQKTR
ncbi:MAG: NAD(+) diphosphatase [Pseudomonadales bacterium]|nr:NAD(+) diphosphatase [Pseudomonadales bacterium]